MTRFAVRQLARFFGALGLSFWLSGPDIAGAGHRSRLPASTPELETVLTEGRELETQRRWSEAVSLYEEASRKNPGQPALEERLDLAKIHYDIGRRYADTTFRKNLVTLSESESLDCIRRSPVASLRTTCSSPIGSSLSIAGTLGLSRGVVRDAVHRGEPDQCRGRAHYDFRRQLQQVTANRQIRDRNEARDVVAQVGRLAQTTQRAPGRRRF